ncbi:MAG: hypothetical protein JW759_02385 [Candidatus Coatesbacteria bacterium]|nr:hypothetical protein [Candidatus Coatesbacteria bacterium]
MSRLKKAGTGIVSVCLLSMTFLALSTTGYAKEAQKKDVFEALQLAETVSGPGQFALPLFAPIDLGSGYEDTVAPFVVLTRPAPNEVDVPIETSIMISLADYGSGVDESTLAMFLDDKKVSPEVSGRLENTIDLTYQNPEPFECAREIRVAISAGDFAQNTMSPNVFSFKTNTDATRRPTIGISTNKTVFMEGQLLVLLASLKNPTDEPVSVRAYVAVGFGNVLLFWPSLTPEPIPMGLMLPTGFEMDPTVIWTTPLFGLSEGAYTWFAALENAETGELGQISTSQFEFASME